jgi:hypothetical protein
MDHNSKFMKQRLKETNEYLGTCMFYAYHNEERINHGFYGANSITKASMYSSF